MEVSSCAEGFWMEEYGVETAGCFTKDVWEKCCGKRLNIPKTKGKRKDCSCILGFDLGGYGGCRMDCVYCYGRGDERREGHNPLSPLLFGWPGKNDEIRKVKAESWIDGEGWLL